MAEICKKKGKKKKTKSQPLKDAFPSVEQC